MVSSAACQPRFVVWAGADPSARQDLDKRHGLPDDVTGHHPEMAEQFGFELCEILFGGQIGGIGLGRSFGDGLGSALSTPVSMSLGDNFRVSMRSAFAILASCKAYG